MNKRQKEITEAVIGILKDLLNPYKIIIFGSRAEGDNRKHSDFDFAVGCPRPSVATERKMRQQIEKISGLYKIDIVYLDSIEDKFRQIIFKTGRTIYDKRRT